MQEGACMDFETTISAKGGNTQTFLSAFQDVKQKRKREKVVSSPTSKNRIKF